MLIDEVKINIKAGKGGDGIVAFEKAKFSQGPTGGNGGNGGNIYFKGTVNIAALSRFRYQKDFAADDGQRGMTQKKHGKNGDDLILIVPNGTIIHNLVTGEDVEIMNEESVILAKGGRGGRGNFTFRSSVNTTPKESTPGAEGEAFKLFLELRLIADIGLIGLPNVGKSSLLNELTKANVKVADYHFTTLEPNLGAYKNVILADIPGLIEGAAEGKGLGHRFLKHIKRTKAFFHLISADSKDVAKDYKIIREEIGKFEESLLEKPEYVFISRTDLVPEKELKEKIKILKKLNKNILAISIHDSEAMEKIEKLVLKLKK